MAKLSNILKKYEKIELLLLNTLYKIFYIKVTIANALLY